MVEQGKDGRKNGSERPRSSSRPKSNKAKVVGKKAGEKSDKTLAAGENFLKRVGFRSSSTGRPGKVAALKRFAEATKAREDKAKARKSTTKKDPKSKREKSEKPSKVHTAKRSGSKKIGRPASKNKKDSSSKDDGKKKN